jgi:tetratricopeptide (TPR) repeat protein
MRTIGALVLPAVLVLLSPAAFAQQEESIEMAPREIQGAVRIGGTNRAIAGATVYLESSVGEVLQQVSLEGSGRFTFSVHKGTFYIRVVAPGFRETRERVDLNLMRRVTVNINLVPVPGSGETPPAESTVDKEYLQIPENARKEFEQGSKLLKEKKAAASVERFRKALALHEKFPAAHFLLGTAFMDLRQWPEAQAELEKSIALDGTQAAAHFALGTCLAQQGKFAAAELPLKRGLELNPNVAEGQLEMGKVYWSLGRWAQAEPHARKAIELQPNLPLAHILLGNILVKKQDNAGALAQFKEYLKLEPSGPFANGAKDMIARLQATVAR